MKELNTQQIQDVNGGVDLVAVIESIGDTGKEIGKWLHDQFHDC